MHPRARILILAILYVLVESHAVPAPARSRRIEDTSALIRQLADPAMEWSAASQLQRAGPAAIAAVVAHLREDGFRDRDHGNHSPTMRALEKIGDGAVNAIDAALTPSVLSSTNDVRYVESAALVLARIRTASSVRTLLRIALSSPDPKVQAVALGSIVEPAFGVEEWRPGRSWESCLRRQTTDTCPFHTESASLAAAAKPLLEKIRGELRPQSASVRLAAAQLLAAWGEEAVRASAHQELLRLSADSSNPHIQQYAIRTLGHLGVDDVRAVIKNLPAGSDEDVQRATAETLARLGDNGYRRFVSELMTRARNENDYRRKWAIQFAGQSRDTFFVPQLIDFLTQREFEVDALAALRALTFQDLGRDVRVWREWWLARGNENWQGHLTRFVATVLPQMATAEPWILNEWMTRLEDADDPAVLPFVTAYFRHPRFNISQVGPNSFRGGGGTPRALVLLLNLAEQGSQDALELLYECSERKDYPTAIDCAELVAVFDHQAAVDRLRSLRNEPYSYWIAHALVQLGDRESIPMLIQQLQAGSSARSLALDDLKRYTQEDFGFDATAWGLWWREQGSSFSVKLRQAEIDLNCCLR